MIKVTQAHVEARREAILDAAFRLFIQKGIEGARMEEIAAEAGLSAGAVYRYYTSKEDLLREVFYLCLHQAADLFAGSGADGSSPLTFFLTAAGSVWQEIGSPKCRDLTILGMESSLAGARSAEDVAGERRRLWEGLIAAAEGVLRQAQDAGEMDASIDARALTVTLLGTWLGLNMLSLDRVTGVDPDSSFKVIEEIMRRFAPLPKP